MLCLFCRTMPTRRVALAKRDTYPLSSSTVKLFPTLSAAPKLPAPSAGCRPGGAPLPAARLRLLPEAMSQGMSQPLESTQRFWDDDDDDDHEIEEATSARLIRVEDGRDGEATPVPPQGAVLSIGRSSSEEHSCNLVLHDAEKRPPVVSSRHALLQDSGGSLQLHILSTSSFT